MTYRDVANVIFQEHKVDEIDRAVRNTGFFQSLKK